MSGDSVEEAQYPDLQRFHCAYAVLLLYLAGGDLAEYLTKTVSEREYHR